MSDFSFRLITLTIYAALMFALFLAFRYLVNSLSDTGQDIAFGVLVTVLAGMWVRLLLTRRRGPGGPGD